LSTPAVVRIWESNFTLYKRVWASNVLGAFIQPLLYLMGMGLGVGALVDRRETSTEALDGLTYFGFLAPGLLATTAMMVCATEAMWPTMGGFKWQRSFHAQAATPLTPGQISSGLACWHATRAFISTVGVGAVLVFFADTRSFGLLVAIPFAVLTGLAFATPITAWSSTREQDQSFPAIQRFVLVPLFLFAGAFFPIEQLPDWMEPIAWVTPLWHGVELCRQAVHGRLEFSTSVLHGAVLLAFAVAGLLVSRRTFAKRLAS
jgi:lipooligosaccharide transport system permease protein